MIVGVAQVALLVRDYDEAIAFYSGKLGFAVAEDTGLGEKRWVRLRAPGGAGCELVVSRATGEEQLACVGRQAGGRVFLYLRTDDFDGDYARFRAAGVEFCELPRDEAYGRVAVMKDLYGNRIDLIQPSSA